VALTVRERARSLTLAAPFGHGVPGNRALHEGVASGTQKGQRAGTMMRKPLAALAAALLVTAIRPQESSACTSFLVTRGATTDSSSMITYAADAHDLYGELYYRPEKKFPPGTKAEVREWDTDKVIGFIPQVAQTYRVVGNMNEHQVVIGETTFGGRDELENPKGGIDYGSLMYMGLQRARTARELIQTIAELADAHGYKSHGESFSIADPNEVWLMEIVGKGPGGSGAVWVAMRVPDGYVTAHANQSRIRQFPRNKPDECLFSKDVVSFAREKGWFTGKDEDFSFADTYSPADCGTKRGCDGRVWAFYHRVAPSQGIPADYVLCKKDAPPLPLWVKPDKKLSPADLMKAMRDHFEDTPMEMRKDVGAGPYALPYRWRPMTWKVDGNEYTNERAVATQQTGFSFVSQSRASLPNPVGGLLWFSVDDTASTVYVPMYAGIKRVSVPYAVGTGTFTKFSWDSAWWVFNWVANQAYGRYSDMIVDIQKVQGEFEGKFLADQAAFEQKVAEQYKTNPTAAEDALTKYSDESSQKVVKRWRELGQELLVKYLDGNVRNEKNEAKHPPYPEHWYRRIAKETGDHFLIATASASASAPPSASASAAPSAQPSAPAKSSCAVSLPGPSGLPLIGLALLIGAVRRAMRRRG
jgi:dipeptidase